MSNEEEMSLEGMLKAIIMDHRDTEVTGVLVLVFEGEEAHVYNSNIKEDIVKSISKLLGPQH